MATDITRYIPGDEFRQMQRLMDRLWSGSPRVAREDVDLTTFDDATLPVDVFERDGNLVLKAALPGVDPKDIHVDVNDGVLYIRAETKTETDVAEGDWHRQEFRYGRYARSFRMPPNVDLAKSTAKYENGMLRLTFPKTEAAKAKSIQIEVR